MLPITTAEEVIKQTNDWPFSMDVLARATAIVEQVQTGGLDALKTFAQELDGWNPDRPLMLEADACAQSLHRVSRDERELLERLASRIEQFARAQLQTIRAIDCAIPGGRAGQTVQPLRTAGCYVPGGRYPLVSSLLMTAVTARTAGVSESWVACPAPADLMLAAAAIAGVRGVLCAGGAQAIAALAYGVGLPRCDVIVGPGNQWVTAAKFWVSANVRIDMLAGPTELLVVADEFADVSIIAADLLAQAEHDVEARPMLIAPTTEFVDRVRREIQQQLPGLATGDIAAAALQRGFAVVASNEDEVVSLCEAIAPEHLELHCKNSDRVAERVTRCGCVFIGAQSAEVLGDYGAGPNHVLPTGGTARYSSGLSVEHFLRRQSWLRIDDVEECRPLLLDAMHLALCEGLAGHAQSGRRRLVSSHESPRV